MGSTRSDCFSYCLCQVSSVSHLWSFYRVSNVAFTAIFVYAYNDAVQRRELWAELKKYCTFPVVKNLPAIVMGDFNQILTADELYSINPSTLPLSGMEYFQACLFDSELVDLESRGTLFTWNNGRLKDPILRKLDRVLIN